MLTLKVITTDLEGQNKTHLFYGERIQHKEISADKRLEFNLGANQSVIGTMSDTPSSTQPYTYSTVFIYGESDTPKLLLWILPCSDCYVMQNGKTIDTFSARYK